MNERIQNIYKIMKETKEYRLEAWYKPMIDRIQKQINLHAIDAVNNIPRWSWYNSCDGIWQNWHSGYFKKITKVSKKIKEIKKELKQFMREERAYKEAAEILEVAIDSHNSDSQELAKHGIVPFRDRKHTKGVFRRI